jgi:hypothetical protein
MGSWAVCIGDDGSHKFVVRIDEHYRRPEARGQRQNRVSVRFLGGYMLQSPDNREEFEAPFIEFLKGIEGVFVLGVARNGSYTFHAYAGAEVQPDSVPVPDKLRDRATVSVYHDPEWREYESWLPNRSSIFARLRGWLIQLFNK